MRWRHAPTRGTRLWRTSPGASVDCGSTDESEVAIRLGSHRIHRVATGGSGPTEGEARGRRDDRDRHDSAGEDADASATPPPGPRHLPRRWWLQP